MATYIGQSYDVLRGKINNREKLPTAAMGKSRDVERWVVSLGPLLIIIYIYNGPRNTRVFNAKPHCFNSALNRICYRLMDTHN
jgi:hypothetical protein